MTFFKPDMMMMKKEEKTIFHKILFNILRNSFSCEDFMLLQKSVKYWSLNI